MSVGGRHLLPSLLPPAAPARFYPKVRAGATLLFDSEPALEEAETELKASAMIDAVTRGDPQPGATGSEVWYSMVWYSMVLYGMYVDLRNPCVRGCIEVPRATGLEVLVWCGVVWYGTVWYGIVWYGMVCALIGGTLSSRAGGVRGRGGRRGCCFAKRLVFFLFLFAGMPQGAPTQNPNPTSPLHIGWQLSGGV